ncbi:MULTISPECIES: enoyl-CoA hydratase [unclassified Methylobacterium]|uniref:enoyl-CoA hydratase n=1 Tax=unclassified Methylobacterium TaxID=2615210 RepID=UPI0006F6390A|nr:MULTISPECIES: enoyl-CoA hydratase [unclassified Methylobacterium]KQP92330.1 enoyl-CoA hydratase [Methylobacterium sp. Leaf113]KQP95986.1 enoyl-CoA hydratase [Methylobacterium sp. Leaf117]MCK2053016.1 enoyl-CoA hydratase/isomerase family protein [Methylobacterium sp. 37f]
MTRPADDGAVRYRVEGGVAHLTFDRPSARNAMTFAMYEALAEALGRIEADPAVRVAVLRGAGGKAFVAGTDIEQFVGFTGQDGVAYEARIDGYIAGLEAVRVPTVAVIEGFAVGGGLAIANACDIRIAEAGARFGVPIARTLGNCLSPANLRRLTATLGPSLVARMLLLAEMPSAETLAPLGYLAAVVAPDALEAEVAGICDRLLGHAPVTLRVTRAMLRRLARDAEADATDLIAECYGSRDFAEGVEAFLARRPAAWTGT